ncbi:helix-turn-helix transcriptional regulator [Idiomarina sp.]|uniref:helix-turn-helix domain-containing protein n=1 Tax=Idiomarina sp. TaxID=1874361 RepID=UPI0025BA1416|nr:helix-turn-helix transcriptional regulator [Idiomarina sp.]NQZ03618.1 helix-turn-helix transcriptional regulator [Idiomarina sp.]
MSELTDRLKRARAHTGLNQTEFARQAGLTMRGYQAQERAISKPSFPVLEKSIEFGINANWLIAGKGEMLLEDTPTEKYQALRKAAEEALKYIDARTKGIALDVKDSLRIELYGTLSGQPEDTQESKPPEANPLEAQVIDNKEKINILWGCARDMNTAIECLREMHERTRQPLIKRVWGWVFGNNIKA